MDISIVIAILTIIGNVILALFQIRHNRASAKEKEAAAAGILIDRAIEVAQKEVEYLKEVVNLLQAENKELKERIKQLEVKQ